MQDVASWNVLLRPVARLRRAASGQREREVAGVSEMERVAAPANAGLRAAVAVESRQNTNRMRNAMTRA